MLSSLNIAVGCLHKLTNRSAASGVQLTGLSICFDHNSSKSTRLFMGRRSAVVGRTITVYEVIGTLLKKIVFVFAAKL